MDFERSNVLTRAILLRGMFELLATLHRRGLPTASVAAAIGNSLSIVAKDMLAALPLLNAILANKTLPAEEFSIGTWVYDSAARQRKLIDVFSELSALYATLLQLLLKELKLAMTVCSVLGTDAASFLTPSLVKTLLCPDHALPRDVKREALALVCAVCEAASPRHDDSSIDAAVHATAAQQASKERSRGSLCDVMLSMVIPLLERSVQKDYHMWGDRHAASSVGGTKQPMSSSSSAVSMDMDAASGTMENAAEHVGAEKVEALARCYALLVCCDRLSWSVVENKVAQPFSFSFFWKQANAAYRHFAVFFLAHVLAHAPSALQSPSHAASILRVWLCTLVADTGKRQCAWYLTQVLSQNTVISPLFDGISDRDVDIRGDTAGSIRAALIARVMDRILKFPAWKQQLPSILGELDVLLAIRRKEIEATAALDVERAVLKWESTGLCMVLSLLRVASSAMMTVHGRPRDVAASQLRRLMSRCAAWALGHCAAVHRSMCAEAPAMHASLSMAVYTVAAAGEGVNVQQQSHHEEPILGASTATTTTTSMTTATIAAHTANNSTNMVEAVDRARKELSSTPFPAALTSLVDILVSINAPSCFDIDQELLEPLWMLVTGCIDLSSGKAIPTATDVATFETMANALLPSPASSSEQQQRDDDEEAKRYALCMYVLDTFVRRYMLRSSLKHVSNERSAVNAVRWAHAVLRHPYVSARMDVLQKTLNVILWPMLMVLNPDGGADASMGSKDAVYALCMDVAVRYSRLVPPMMAAERMDDPDALPAVMQAFWLAICRDILRCVASRLPVEIARQRLDHARTIVNSIPAAGGGAGGAAAGAADTSSDSNGQLATIMKNRTIWPSTDQTIAEAKNAMLSALGRPRTLDAVERMYSRPGHLAQLLTTALKAISNGGSDEATSRGPHQQPTATTNSTMLFRPGDFPWKVAQHGITMLCTLCTLDQGNGVGWTAACFPALHFLIAGSGQASKLLHKSYKELRRIVDSMMCGQQEQQTLLARYFPLVQVKPPPVQDALPHGASSANASVDEGTTSPTRTLQFLSTSPSARTCKATIVVSLSSVRRAAQKSSGDKPGAIAVVRDDSDGTSGAPVWEAKVVVTAQLPVLVNSLLAVKPGQKIVLTDVQVLKQQQGQPCILKATSKTRVTECSSCAAGVVIKQEPVDDVRFNKEKETKCPPMSVLNASNGTLTKKSTTGLSKIGIAKQKLMDMGYSENDAMVALRNVQKDTHIGGMDAEEVFHVALKRIVKNNR